MFFLLSFAGGGIVQQEPLEQRIASAPATGQIVRRTVGGAPWWISKRPGG